MADPWAVINQTPSQTFEDQWTPIEESFANPWQPVSQVPISHAPSAFPAQEPSSLQKIHQKIDPEPIIGGIGVTVGHMLQGLLSLPQRAIEGSQQDIANMGTGEPMASLGPAAETAMSVLPISKTVGGVRAHPHPSEMMTPGKIETIPGVETPIAANPTEPVAKPTVAENAVAAPMPEAWKVTAEEPISKTKPLEEPAPEQLNKVQQAANKLREIFHPEGVSEAAGEAAGDIRAAGGRATRDTETTRTAFEEVQKITSKLSDEQKIALNDYIETRSVQEPLANKELQVVADVQREAVQARKAKIEALDSTAKAEFREDYLPHIYKDLGAAKQEFSGPSKEGSGRFLKERTIPTLKEAMAKGLEPITLDPLEMTQRYVDTMDRFLATREVLDKWKQDGTAKPYTPGEQPKGWVEINTRQSGSGMPLYAPVDVARIYNNFVDRGWNNSATWGPVLNGVQHTANAITSLKLGLSGFHATTMAKEAYASGLDLAVAQMASGKPLKAALSVAKAPTKFIENAFKGKAIKDVYLGKSEGTPQMREIVDLLTEAGGRMAGNKHAVDYKYSAMDSYWNTFKRGSTMAEIKAAAGEARQFYGLGSIKVLAQQFGRVMQTVAKPLFEHYIPALKNGAAYDMMSAWFDANPKATHAEQVKAARKVVDAIDDRFGEMIQDNIFWNKTMKQSLQTAMLSYSWFLGTARAIGGGTASLVRNPARLSMKHPDWKPQANYALALPAVVATANATYQYLKTGTSPDSIQDLMAPETGGLVPGVGTTKLIKERGQTPGYEKDVFGWLHNPKDEAYNKLGGIIQLPHALIRNKDWKDQPIRHSGAPAAEQVKQLLGYIYEQLKPISVSKIAEGQQKGSNISKLEMLFGIKNAPAYLQDPEGSDKMAKFFADKEWKKRQNWEKSHTKKYGGP